MTAVEPVDTAELRDWGGCGCMADDLTEAVDRA